MITFHFVRRGYPKTLLLKAFNKVKDIDRISLLEQLRKETQENEIIFLISTYIPGFNGLKDIVQKNWGILSRSNTTKRLSEHRLVHGYHRPKNLWESSVRAKLPKVSSEMASSKKPNCETRNKCNTKNCEYCAILDHSGRITSTYTGRIYYAGKNVTCKSSNIIYYITCKACKKQYMGQTTLRCMDRIQAHFNAITSKDPRQQTDISRHFKQNDHNGRADVQVHILDFIYAFPDTHLAATMRDETEFRWIHRLRTQLPMGINTMDKPHAQVHYSRKPKTSAKIKKK